MFDPWPLRTKDNLLGEVILLSGSPYPEGLVSGFWPEDTLGNQKIIKTIFSLWVCFNLYRQSEKTTFNGSVKEPFSNTLPLWPVLGVLCTVIIVTTAKNILGYPRRADGLAT